jgi:hypothetical protein
VGPLHQRNLLDAGFVDVVDDRRKVRPLLEAFNVFGRREDLILTLTSMNRSRSHPGPQTQNKKN